MLLLSITNLTDVAKLSLLKINFTFKAGPIQNLNELCQIILIVDTNFTKFLFCFSYVIFKFHYDINKKKTLVAFVSGRSFMNKFYGISLLI